MVHILPVLRNLRHQGKSRPILEQRLVLRVLICMLLPIEQPQLCLSFSTRYIVKRTLDAYPFRPLQRGPEGELLPCL